MPSNRTQSFPATKTGFGVMQVCIFLKKSRPRSLSAMTFVCNLFVITWGV